MERSAALLTPPLVTAAIVRASSSDGRPAALKALDRAERLLLASRYAEAIEILGQVVVPTLSSPDLALRAHFCHAWAQMHLGNLASAVTSLERARVLAEGPSFKDVDRAEAMFRLGCCRLKLGKVSNAISLLSSALDLAERGGVAGDQLRAKAFDWRSRCYQLQREWEAAQSDAERSLELAEAVCDDRLVARAQMQCSLVAERLGEPMVARCYAERALSLTQGAGDRQTAARLLNNLGGLSFLLGEPEVAVGYLTKAFALSLELGNDGDAAQAISSLAQVHLRCGAPLLAEEQARHALSILSQRDDYLDERGNVHLVLGRALLELDRDEEALAEFAAAEWLFEKLGTASHIAAAWVAQGDAFKRAGDTDAAMALYRRAAEALQDFRF